MSDRRSTTNATITQSTEIPVVETVVAEPGDKSSESVPFYLRALRAVRPKYATEKKEVGADKNRRQWKSILRH
jgi:hypothetical protein